MEYITAGVFWVHLYSQNLNQLNFLWRNQDHVLLHSLMVVALFAELYLHKTMLHFRNQEEQKKKSYQVKSNSARYAL